MVTIDNIVKNVGTFNGNLEEGKTEYEIARQGLALIESATASLEKNMKGRITLDDTYLAESRNDKMFRLGNVTFLLKSEARIKRPAFKEAVEMLESRVSAVNYLSQMGRTIAGVVKDPDGRSYIPVEWLKEDAEITISSILVPELKQTINYETEGSIAGEITNPASIQEIALSKNLGLLTIENAENYVRMKTIAPRLEEYVASYESALKKEAGRKTEKTVAVGESDAYKVKKEKAEGVDWAYVAKQLFLVPTDKKSVGELFQLADNNLNLMQKVISLSPTYRLWERQVSGEKRHYVALQSVYDRIQELKEDEDHKVTSKRTKVVSKSVV
jgi:hypothetical protein